MSELLRTILGPILPRRKLQEEHDVPVAYRQSILGQLASEAGEPEEAATPPIPEEPESTS